MKKRFPPLILVLLALFLLFGRNYSEQLTTQPQDTTPAQIQSMEENTGNSEAEDQETVQETEANENTALPSHLEQSGDEDPDGEDLPESGEYTSKEDVARYIYLYGHLPSNFITKKEAKALGWVSSQGNLGQVAPGKSIGGDYFGNYEENLPEASGREYHECDIDADGGYRGAKRIVFSNDGLIYYTEDHYEHFQLLYGEE